MDMQASTVHESTADTSMIKPRKTHRAVLFSLLGLAVATASGGAYEYWKLVGSRYVSTDDAYTAAEVAQVASETEGSVIRVNVVDSQNVKRGDILVMIDDTDAKLVLRRSAGGSCPSPGASDRSRLGRRAHRHRPNTPRSPRDLGLCLG